MRSLCLFCILAMALSLVTLAAVANDTPDERQSAVQEPQIQAESGGTGPYVEPSVAEMEARAFLKDLRIQRNLEIDTLLAKERLEVEALQKRFEASNSPSQRLALQRAIEAAKHSSQIQLLEVQAKYAGLAGNTELVEQIEQYIEELEKRADHPIPTDQSN